MTIRPLPNRTSKLINQLISTLIVLSLILPFSLTQTTSTQAQSDPAPTTIETAASNEIQANLTVLVTTATDEFDTPALPGKVSTTKCSLREALQIIVVPKSGDRGCKNLPEVPDYAIKFAGGGVYKLTRPDALPTITKRITLYGQKQAVTIDGNKAARATGIFLVVSNGVLTLSEVVLTNGNSLAGGAINNTGGEVIISESRLINNQVGVQNQPNGEGGAIYSTGALSITKSFFGENQAKNTGGAIHAGGGANTVIVESAFVKNRSNNGGGAIYSKAGGTNVVQIFKSEFVENQVSVENRSTYDLLQDDAIGGAIRNDGNFYGYQLSFERNFTLNTKGGGAFANKMADGFEKVQLVESAFEENHADTTLALVANTFGGAIYNDGEMLIKSNSIHNNKATVAGGVFNRNKHMVVANTTIASNEAKTLAGFANGSPLHANSNFGTVNFYHVTHVNNQDQVDLQSPLFSLQSFNIYLSNSIVDGGCLNKTLYSNGYNVFGKACLTTPKANEPQVSNPAPVADLGLQSLTYNGGPQLNAGFYTIKVQAAIDAAAHGEHGCDYSHVAHRDQVQREREPSPAFCDAGALEIGTAPPQWKSTEVPNRGFPFPLVIQGEKTSTNYSLQISNVGGGVITWELLFEANAGQVYRVTSQAMSGGLSRNQSATIDLECKPTQFGAYLGTIVFKTNLPGQQFIRHHMYCRYVPANLNTVMWSYYPQKPGSAGAVAPGTPTTLHRQVGNQGLQDLKATVTAKTNDALGHYIDLFLKAKSVPLVSQVNAAAASETVIIPPGGEIDIEVICTPPGPGLFVSTLEIASEDPLQPLLSYDISCEGLDVPQAAKLQPSDFYQHQAQLALWGIAVSPDGKQLLAGRGTNNVVETFGRTPATGKLTRAGDLSVPGMSGIRDIAYSHDGNFVYYTSSFGNGIVELKRNNIGALSISHVITSGTPIQYCVINNPLPSLGLCPLNSLGGAFALALSPDDLNLYVVSEQDSTLTAFVRDPKQGVLFATQIFTKTIAAIDTLDGAGDVLVSPDGKHIYVTARQGDTLSLFSRSNNGTLRFLRTYKDGEVGFEQLNFPGNMAMSNDGRFLYVPSYGDNTLNIFARSAADGGLELVQTLPGIAGVFDVALSHDSAQLRLVASLYDGDALHVYQRDEATGKLTFVEAHQHSEPGSPLSIPVRLATSPDDGQIYLSLIGSRGVRAFDSIKPTPVVFSTSPASMQAGSGLFTLQVTGVRFNANSVIVWNGEVLPTSLIDGQTLRASIDAAKIASAGAATILVRNPQPGGGDSNNLALTITTPDQPGLPSITSINPPAITPGDEDVALLIKGANFTAQTQVLVNGKPIPTDVINSSTLLALLLAADRNAEGPVAITAVNGGSVLAAEVTAQSSAAFKFVMAPAGAVAQPAISSLSPQSLVAGNPATMLTIHGYNFSQGAENGTVAHWNGDLRPTTVLDANTLLVQLSASDLFSAGAAEVMVYTPGQEKSNALPFTIRQPNDNPQPLLNSYGVEPSGDQWTLVVGGTDFVAGAQATLNGAPRTVNLVAAQELHVTLTSADLTSGGLLQVVNPTPGGGGSNELVIAPRQDQAIVFDSLASKVVSDAPFGISAAASSELPVIFSSSTPAACTVEEGEEGWRVTLVAVGTCTIVATQTGDGFFNPAQAVERSFQVMEQMRAVYLPFVARATKLAAQANAVEVVVESSGEMEEVVVDEGTVRAYLPLVAR